MPDYDRLERAELNKYKVKKVKPAKIPKPHKPAKVYQPKPQADTRRRLTDKQIKSLIKKSRKPKKESRTWGGIHKVKQNKTLSRKSRIRLI
jgi:hypothetical protein